MRALPRAFAILALSVCAAAFAQDAGHPPPPEPLTAQQEVSPKAVKLGEPFTRTVTLTHEKDQRYELVLPSDWGEFELLGHQRRRKDRGDQATTVFTLQMSAFELGKRTLPPLTFEVVTPQGAARWTGGPAEVEVVSSLPDDAQQQGANLYDIRPPEEVPVPSYALLWALLVAIAVAILAYLLYRWWKRPRPEGAIAQGPPLPPEVRARKALEALAKEDLPSQGRIKEFYVRLTDIVRGYVGERYGVEALECTSSELMDRLRHVPAPELPREPFSAFLTEADLVKFAKAQMTPEDCARAWQFAHHFVDVTTPKAPPPDAPAR